VASVIVTSLLLSAVTRLLLPQRGHPIEFKRRPIHLKRDTCANSAVGTEAEYDIPLHVGALLIILFVSGFACAFPLIAKKFPRLRIPKTVFFLARHFGTGVLVATAFVHLLPTAFISLGDPCLSGFFTQDYPPMPGAIALAGIFFVTIIEMVFHPARQIYESNPPDTNSLSGNERSSAGMLAGSPDDRREADNDRDSMSRVSDLGPLHGRNDSVSRQLSRLDQGGDIAPAEGDPPLGRTGKTEADTGAANADVERSSHDLRLTPEQLHRKQILQCMLLEMGILFHSVFIGMALSVSVGTNFIVLLVAISFHRTWHHLRCFFATSEC
jgi:zinc transporter ZupT